MGRMVLLRKLAWGCAVGAALASQMAAALGLGEIRLHSTLNQPLVAEIQLLDSQAVDLAHLRPALAKDEDFKRAQVERIHFLSELDFQVQDKRGQKVISIVSQKPVREPYLDLLVELVWPEGRMVRQYTVLLDVPR